jgi:hypothetical protein
MEPNTQRLIQGAAGAAREKIYVEDVFSTYLYTGNGSTQTITNDIDLAGEGGLVWIKGRGGLSDHILQHNTTQYLSSNTTAAASDPTSVYVTSFNSTGFSLGFGDAVNKATAPSPYASWTFRKAEKFFDIVTYTSQSGVTEIPHNLGSVPGCIIVKKLNGGTSWTVYHRSTGETKRLELDGSGEAVTNSAWGNTLPTSTHFTIDPSNNNVFGTLGDQFVAYLFAHDAGGFGDSDNDSVVKCGSYTGNGSATGPTIDLGWEPQWLLIKRATVSTGDWLLFDNMRLFADTASGDSAEALRANATSADAATRWLRPLNTGFQPLTTATSINASGSDYIYIAIRRGPMKTPTDATKVFHAATSAASAGTAITTSFPVDLQLAAERSSPKTDALDRLRGVSTTSTALVLPRLATASAAAESSNTYTSGWGNTGFLISAWYAGTSTSYFNFRRAPGFFDVVATSNNSSGSIKHNLTVTPELVIAKARGTTGSWRVACSQITGILYLEATDAKQGTDTFQTLVPCSATNINLDSVTQNTTNIAYLFASCPGVSKVGSYTGTGTTLNIDCGFTAGARLVLIKRTDSTGDWYIYDTARGIVSGNDSYLLLNSTAAEVTTTDYIDPYSAGFEISSTAPADINANGGNFIFLAIA